ncbi:MAG: ferrous iron transporter B [Clostridia bacterium]|nr:ferrous iron transporter B [Clostridia bacterium]
MIKFALAGNPNSGKTTLFNSLTGSTAHVGNWPGVTVDKKEGVYKKCGEPIQIVDLPGIYSLSPYTPEEVIARNYILDEKPDCVINIVDATNIERNLYLTTQIMEIDVPVVVALNFIDSVEKQGDKIDEKELEKRLGVPVVKVSALKQQGLDELMQRAYATSQVKREGVTVISEKNVKHLIGDVKIALNGQGVANPLFHAIKLVENDEIEVKMHKDTVKMVEEFKNTFTDDVFGTEYEALIADARYKYITKNLTSVVVYKNPDKFKMNDSSKADKVLTHRIWGIPIFIAILFAIFHLTFSENFLFLGSIFALPTLEDLGLLTAEGEFSNFGVKLLSCVYDGTVFSPGCILNNLWNEILVGELFNFVQGLVENSGLQGWAIGLINNGILDGVSAVLSFLPWILVLFLLFSILEDSGYMARIAFILDKLFRKFGLSGRAFLPMIMGFGCSIPAMINTRTLADDKEKTATIRVIPFFSCGAKLPILTAITGAIVSYFGVGNADIITFGMYILGVVTAIVSVLLMRSTSLKGETPPFIMELPTYHLPQFKNLMLHLWDKAKHFISKAFTIILASTIVIWVLSHFSFAWVFLSDEQIDQSILANVGKLFQPIFTPLGFGSQLGKYGWVFIVGAVTGLIAKENVIATFSTLAACLMSIAGLEFGGFDIASEDGIGAVSAMITATNVTVPALISYIAFNMTTIPCFAAVATARAELNNKKTFNSTLIFWLLASYTVSAIVYTVGTWWWTLFIWLLLIAVMGSLIYLNNKKFKKGA